MIIMGSDNMCQKSILHYYNLGMGSNNHARDALMNQSAIPLAAPTVPVLDKMIGIIDKMENDGFPAHLMAQENCTVSVGKWNCNHLDFRDMYRTEVDSLRTQLRKLDEQKVQLFVDESSTMDKLLVLLGDKYREEISYQPAISKTAPNALWYRAYFANSTVYNNRNTTTNEKNLGNFVYNYVREPIKADALTGEPPIIPTQTIDITTTEIPKEKASGMYVWPAKTVTIRRTDNSNVSAKVFINRIRPTTRVYNNNGYNRPHFISTPWFLLNSGESITLSNPYGGPLYFWVDKTENPETVSFAVEGAGTHPVLNNPGDPAAVMQFSEDIKNTKAEWVVVSTEFLMMHSRIDHWKKSIDNNRYRGNTIEFLDDIWNYLIKNTYLIAGYQNGSNLMPSDKVLAYCREFGIDCLDKRHSIPESIQHAVSDSVAMCGGLCSGNPYDTSGPIGAISWGDAHEIGHNLQRDVLKIYGNSSIESSNNIYPYALFQKYNETQSTIGSMVKRDLELVSRTVKIPIPFRVIKESFSQANPTEYAREQMWQFDGSNVYKNNFERYSFYVQLSMFAKYYNPDTMDTGWELYSLLNIMQREYAFGRKNSNNWEITKAKIGLENYTHAEAQALTNAENINDFMLITTSKIIKKDMRPVFAMWGIINSDKAKATVENMGLTPAEKFFFPMYHRPRYYKGETPILMTANAEYTYPEDYTGQ